MSVVVGIDGGTVRLGFAAIECNRGQPPRLLTAETISAAAHWSRTERLILIARDLREAFTEFPPDWLGLEDAGGSKYATAYQALGEARGVVIACATCPGDRISTMTSQQWKTALMIPGNADKARVQDRVRFLFRLRTAPAEDASDACGIAFFVAVQRGLL